MSEHYRIYRFSLEELDMPEAVAHGGVGTIRTKRMEERRTGGGANFLDLTIVPPGASIGFHTHGAYDEEIYVVVSGIGRMRIGNHTCEVGPGDVIINPAHGQHGLVNSGTELLRLVVLDIPVHLSR